MRVFVVWKTRSYILLLGSTWIQYIEFYEWKTFKTLTRDMSEIKVTADKLGYSENVGIQFLLQ